MLEWLPDFLRKLDLLAANPSMLMRVMTAERWPIHHGYTPAFLPRPADWRPGITVDGYWFLGPSTGWQPPAGLVDFLESGSPPVFVGFGSMAPEDSERLSRVVSEAVRRAGVRAIVQAGWSGLAGAGDDVMSIGDVPHEWLFPRTAAVVHHGGAGTTGAGVRAGVPAVITPVLGDQPFWAKQVRRAGVSPGSVPLSKVTADRLGELIGQAVREPSYRRNAAELAQRVRQEDGAGRIVEALG